MGEKPFYLSARIKLLRCEGVFQKGLLHSEKARKIPPLQNGYARADNGFPPQRAGHTCATMPYLSVREAGKSLF